MIRELDLNELLSVLQDLDRELNERITVRAVGGFALAWHGVREKGLTADIDTLTDDYPESVTEAIKHVGAQHGLESWWLNNDAAAGDAEFLVESMGLSWERADCDLKMIDLEVADLESLLKLKLSAVEDSKLSGRGRDLDDAIHLLILLGYDKTSFRKSFSYLREDMPHAFTLVSGTVW